MFSFLHGFVNAVTWGMLFIPSFLPLKILPILEDLGQIIYNTSWFYIYIPPSIMSYIFFFSYGILSFLWLRGAF